MSTGRRQASSKGYRAPAKRVQDGNHFMSMRSFVSGTVTDSVPNGRKEQQEKNQQSSIMHPRRQGGAVTQWQGTKELHGKYFRRCCCSI